MHAFMASMPTMTQQKQATMRKRLARHARRTRGGAWRQASAETPKQWPQRCQVGSMHMHMVAHPPKSNEGQQPHGCSGRSKSGKHALICKRANAKSQAGWLCGSQVPSHPRPI